MIMKADVPTITMGSCFASNMANALREKGLPVWNLPLGEEISSPLFSSHILDWIVNGPDKTILEGNILASSKDDFGELARIRQQALEAAEHIRSAQVMIFTLGVGGRFVWIDTGENDLFLGGKPVMRRMRTRKEARLLEFRLSTVLEIKESLGHIVRFIKMLNPTIKTLFTVSPVPLARGQNERSVLVNDCVSKSSLRAACNEFIEQYPDIYYWPSFEMVRWLAPHSQTAFYDPNDQHHVHRGIVTTIMEYFIARCFEEGTEPAGDN